jgi:hypothetical protein
VDATPQMRPTVAASAGPLLGGASIELSELVAHVQDQAPGDRGQAERHRRAAIAVRGSTEGSQSARFGFKGEDFVLARRLQ